MFDYTHAFSDQACVFSVLTQPVEHIGYPKIKIKIQYL